VVDRDGPRRHRDLAARRERLRVDDQHAVAVARTVDATLAAGAGTVVVHASWRVCVSSSADARTDGEYT